MAAEHEKMRQAVFKAAAKDLCDAIKYNTSPTAQLGQSRETLQITAKRVYGQITDIFINTFGKDDASYILKFGMSPKDTDRVLQILINNMTEFR